MDSVAVVRGGPLASGDEVLARDGFEDPRQDDLERDARLGHGAVDWNGAGLEGLVGECFDEGARVESAVPVAHPAAQLAADAADQHAPVACVGVVVAEDLAGQVVLPGRRVGGRQLAQVRVGDPCSAGDLSEGEVGRLVAIVGDVDADARGRDFKPRRADSKNLVSGLVALDGGDDLRGPTRPLVDLALEDGAVLGCLR